LLRVKYFVIDFSLLFKNHFGYSEMQTPLSIGYCIRCGTKIPLNTKNPLCGICGGGCSATNRFSSSEYAAYYCHFCGKPDYISEESPLCQECLENLRRKT